MGFSKKSEVEGGGAGKKWVVAGISIRAALKPITTKQRPKVVETGEEEEEGLPRPTTPTGREARIPDRLPCPAAPRKRAAEALEVPRQQFAGVLHASGFGVCVQARAVLSEKAEIRRLTL